MDWRDIRDFVKRIHALGLCKMGLVLTYIFFGILPQGSYETFDEFSRMENKITKADKTNWPTTQREISPFR